MAHSAGAYLIFRIDAARHATIALASDSLHWPNGITWDKSGNRFIVVPYYQVPQILSWRPGPPPPKTTAHGPGTSDTLAIPPHRTLSAIPGARRSWQAVSSLSIQARKSRTVHPWECLGRPTRGPMTGCRLEFLRYWRHDRYPRS